MIMVDVYLGLGSNLGDREDNLRRAVSLLSRRASLIALSSVYETKPWGYASQPAFLNVACLLETSLSPQDLLELAQSVERDLGRVPSFRYGPRVIDVDILLYGDEVIETPLLQVPTPALVAEGLCSDAPGGDCPRPCSSHPGRVHCGAPGGSSRQREGGRCVAGVAASLRRIARKPCAELTIPTCFFPNAQPDYTPEMQRRSACAMRAGWAE